MKLIDKDALVAEIQRRNKKLIHTMNKLYYASNYKEWKAVAMEYRSLMSFLDTLEVKEVDLEKEIDNYISSNFFGSQTMGFFANRTKEEPNDEDIAIVAKHFFELGLKVQKEEWSNFDTYMMIGLISFLERHKTVETEVSDPSLQDVINWLKTKYGKSN